MRNPKVMFARHYVEMVLVMFAGMLVLGGALLGVSAAFGTGYEELRESYPALLLAGMGFSMTVPMVWWMRFRGHTWAASRAMGLAMIVPSLSAIALLGAGALDIHGGLMVQHIAMFPAMLAAMLPFRAEFVHSHNIVPRRASGVDCFDGERRTT